jgi:cytochrome c oxidase subunit 3
VSAHANADDHHHHHSMRPEDWPDDVQVGTASVGKVGMWIFLLTDALMFAGFLLAYGILRGEQAASVNGELIEYWRCSAELMAQGVDCIAPEPVLGINFTAALTFLLICSSVSMVMAYAACVEKDRAGTLKWLGLTILGGVLFLCGQYDEYFGLLFSHGLINEGLIFGQSTYATTFYLITGFHGCHVLTGVIYLSVMWVRVWMGKYDDGNYDHIEILGLFWHFVDLIWILVFTLVYLVPIE